jgi:hypothetical protein
LVLGPWSVPGTSLFCGDLQFDLVDDVPHLVDRALDVRNGGFEPIQPLRVGLGSVRRWCLSGCVDVPALTRIVAVDDFLNSRAVRTDQERRTKDEGP